MSNQQTAVEWLETKVNGMIENGGDADLLAVIEHIQQAKAIFEQQTIDAYANGHNDGCRYMNNEKQEFEHAEQYYNETFNQTT